MNVLLVDDDPDLLGMLSRFLEKNGYRVLAALDPMEAFSLLEREPVGLVITDLSMPHQDGIGFTRRLKADPRFKDLPVILITANITEDVADQGMRQGVALTLTKPFDFDRLLDLIRFAE